MAIEIPGYDSKGKVNAAWWVNQIEAGKRFRDTWSMKHKWDEWDKFYRSDYVGDKLPINLFFMMVRTMVPRSYFNNPSISVQPAKPGPQHLGLAMVLERTDNKLIRSMNIKNELKNMAQESFFKGTAVGKMGYGAEHVPASATETVADKDSTVDWARTDYRSGIENNMPWVLRVPLQDYVMPAGTIDRNAAAWECHIVYRPIDEIQRDARLKDAKRISATRTADELFETPDIGELWEIHDRRTRMTFIMSPNDIADGPVVVFGPETDSFQSPSGGPFHDIVFNANVDVAYGLPDAAILDPYQREVNEIATQAMWHRRMSIIKLLAVRGTMSDVDKAKLMNEEPLTLLEVDDLNAIRELKVASIPPEQLIMLDRVIDIVRLTMGFSRNQFGEFMTGSEKPTATETQAVREASEIRVDERRDIMADTMLVIVDDINRIVFERWTQKEVAQVLGPFGVPIWVEFNGEMLAKGHYEVNIDPDSTLPDTKSMREQRAVQSFQLLMPMTESLDPRTGLPVIDKTKLVRYLLHELHGTQYDDMILGMPNIYSEEFVRALQQGDNQTREPISPEALGQMLLQNPQGAQAAQSLKGGRGGQDNAPKK